MSNLKHPHQKYIATIVFATDNSVRQYTFGGGGRICTAVHNNFQTTSTNYDTVKSIAITPTANAQAPM